MVNPCPDGFCLTWNFDDPYDGTKGATHPFCYYSRPLYDVGFNPDGTVFSFYTGASQWSWESGYVEDLYINGSIHATLSEYHKEMRKWGGFNDFFTIDPDTRSRCFSPLISTPSPIILSNSGSPPPPSPRKMCGCDCNTIATIVSERMNELIAQKQKQFDAIRDHIDVRAIEQLRQINKMLQGVEIDADLQPIIDEIKRAEANLWNGINGG
ncbi:MAG: hypothetical protein ACBR15_22515 [Microcoleus sp.]